MSNRLAIEYTTRIAAGRRWKYWFRLSSLVSIVGSVLSRYSKQKFVSLGMISSFARCGIYRLFILIFFHHSSVIIIIDIRCHSHACRRLCDSDASASCKINGKHGEAIKFKPKPTSSLMSFNGFVVDRVKNKSRRVWTRSMNDKLIFVVSNSVMINLWTLTYSFVGLLPLLLVLYPIFSSLPEQQ